MNIIVCVKQVVDPEAPPASYKVDAAGNTMVTPPGVSITSAGRAAPPARHEEYRRQRHRGCFDSSR